MPRFARQPRLLIALLCLALVALRVGGLHAHLCLDGSEPPISFHVADSGIHHLDEVDAGETHTDRDLAIASDLVLKKLFGDLDLSLIAAFGALFLFLLARPRGRLVFPPQHPQRSSVRTRLRPEPRGPPRPA